MKRRIAVLVSSFLAVVMLFCSCNKSSENVWAVKLEEGETTIACPVKIGGQEVDFDLFRYCYLTFKEQLESEGSKVDFNDKEAQDALMELAIDQVKYVMAVEETAKSYNFSLSQEDLIEIDDQMKSVFDTVGGAESYKETLAEKFLTHEVYERMLSVNLLYAAMSEELVGTDKESKIVVTFDEAVAAFDKTNYRLASIPFAISMYDEKGNQVSESVFLQNQKDALAKAEKACEKLKTTDFLELMKEYLDEENINTQQYYPIENLSMIVGDEIEGLKVGEYSKPMLTESAYFIFYRLEPDKEYLKENHLQDVILACGEQKLGEILEKKIKDYEVEKSEEFGKITPQTIV